MNETIRVSGVCGSLRPEGHTKMALAVALQGASEYEVDTRLIELREYELVFCGQVDEADYPQDVFRLRQELKESNATGGRGRRPHRSDQLAQHHACYRAEPALLGAAPGSVGSGLGEQIQ